MKPWLKTICEQVLSLELAERAASPESVAQMRDALRTLGCAFIDTTDDVDALIAALIERCEQLQAELDSLSRIEAALPKTADGVPVVPGSGSRLWYIHPDSHTIYERSYTADMRDARSHWIGDHQERHDVVWIGVEQCYSTREAAEAAREAEKARNA